MTIINCIPWYIIHISSVDTITFLMRLVGKKCHHQFSRLHITCAYNTLSHASKKIVILEGIIHCITMYKRVQTVCLVKILVCRKVTSLYLILCYQIKVIAVGYIWSQFPNKCIFPSILGLLPSFLSHQFVSSVFSSFILFFICLVEQ